MRNITLAIDDETYRKIRFWCAMRDISISRVVRTFLNDLPRLEKVRRFPLPEAPDPRSLAAVFDQLDPDDSEALRDYYGKTLPPGLL
jgi:hypothetical protein